MDPELAMAFAVVLSAVIGGPVTWMLKRSDDRIKAFDERNTEQHAANMQAFGETTAAVQRLEGKVDQVGGQLNEHITWHLDERVK